MKWETGDSSNCNYRVTVIPLGFAPPGYDYQVRFTDKGDTGYILHKWAPFEIWNLTNSKKIAWEIFKDSPTDSTDSLRSVWSSGDEITFREEIDNKFEFTWRISLAKNPEFVYLERDTIIEGYREIVYDTTIVNNPPQTGDAFHLVTTRPFHSGDRFCLQTQKVTSHQTTNEELSRVKVVPNPYLVSAGWELHADDHRISFTHLPAKCEIIIFNLTGEVVAILKHDDLHSGTAFWNLQHGSGVGIVPVPGENAGWEEEGGEVCGGSVSG